MKVPELLTITRESNNFTQEEMGLEIGIDNKKLSKWEMGDFNPSLEELKLLSNYFEVEIEELLEEEKKENIEDQIPLFLEEELKSGQMIKEFLLIITVFFTFLSVEISFYWKRNPIFILLICFLLYIVYALLSIQSVMNDMFDDDENDI